MTDFGSPSDAITKRGKAELIDPAKFDDIHRQLSSPPLVRIADSGSGQPAESGVEGAQPAQQGGDKRPFFPNTGVAPEEVEFAGHGLDSFPDKFEAWKHVKEFVNQAGRDPTSAVVDAIKKDKMVGLGELHANGVPSPSREWATAHMKDFARAGATDLFVEMPKLLQPVFDKFNNDPKKGPFQIPDKLVGPDGKPDNRPQADGALKMLREFQESDPELFRMWSAARAAGMKVEPVDNDANGWLFHNPESAEAKRLTPLRNRDMAANMLSELNRPSKPGEPPRKGIAWMGNMDVADGPGNVEGRPALQIMKAELAKTGQRTESFFTQTATNEFDQQWSVFPLALTTRPFAAPTHDSTGKPSILGRMGILSEHHIDPPYNYDNWDQVIVFPARQ
jgi:hypothetical protein